MFLLFGQNNPRVTDIPCELHHAHRIEKIPQLFFEMQTVRPSLDTRMTASISASKNLPDGLNYLARFLCEERQSFNLCGRQSCVTIFHFLFSLSAIILLAIPLVIWAIGKIRFGNNLSSILIWPEVTGLPCQVASRSK